MNLEYTCTSVTIKQTEVLIGTSLVKIVGSEQLLVILRSDLSSEVDYRLDWRLGLHIVLPLLRNNS